MTIGMALVLIVAIITTGIVIVKIVMTDGQFTVDCSNDMHNFEDMYDTIQGTPTITRANLGDEIDIASVIEASKPVSRVYVKSICKHCGKTIKR